MTNNAAPSAPNNQSPRPSLKRRAARGAAWTTAQFATSSVARLASNLILTRLLAPEAFGLVGVAIMMQFLVNMISDIGIKSSVIRSDNTDDPNFVSTAWVLQMARGGLMAGLISLAAIGVFLAARWGWVPASSIYADPRIPLFILFGAATALINGAISIKFQLAERYFRMGWVSITKIAGQLAGSAVTIAIAFFTHDPIALAIGLLVSPSVIAIASHLYFEGPPFSISVKRKYVDEMLSFGVWILVASLFSFFAQRGAQLMFGFLLDAKEFSFLTIALIWINVIRQGLRTIQRRVALPAFSEIRRENPAAQTRIYYRMRALSDGFAVFVFLGTLFVGGRLLDMVYPEDYDRVIFYLHILCITVLFVPYELIDTVLLSDGSSRYFSNIKLITAAAVLIGIPVAFYNWGPEAAVLVSAIAPAAAVPLSLYYGRRTIRMVPWREAIPMGVAALGVVYLLITAGG